MVQNTRRSRSTIRRRDLLAGAGAALSAPFLLGATRARSAEQVVFVAYGGAAQDWYDKLQIAEYTKDTGNTVLSVAGPDIAKLKAQVVTNNVEWDVVALSGPAAVSAEREGLLEKIDYDVVGWPESAFRRQECSFPYLSYWGGVAFDPKRIDPSKAPRNWTQFWNTKAFPGRRGLRDRPDEMLEVALMADGVAPRDLYPLDVDRAFKSLDRIKPYITKWVNQTPQTVSLVLTNELDFSFTYPARVNAAREAGGSIEFFTDQPVIATTYLAIPKGSKKRDAAMKLLSYFVRPDLQAAFSNAMIGNGPTVLAAVPLLSGAARAMQADFRSPQSAFVDVVWWADNYSEISKRFKEWLLTT